MRPVLIAAIQDAVAKANGEGPVAVQLFGEWLRSAGDSGIVAFLDEAKRRTFGIPDFNGVISEIDHTGHWYDPSQTGWGFTVTEQGDVLGAVLYTYNAAGEPTWLAGFNRGIAPRVELFATTGSCPATRIAQSGGGESACFVAEPAQSSAAVASSHAKRASTGCAV